MKKVFLILTSLIVVLSGCSVPPLPATEPTLITSPLPTNVPSPTFTPVSSAPPSPSENSYGIMISLDKTDTLADGYMLYGNISWTDSLIPPYSATAYLKSITDANGNEIPFDEEGMWMYPPQGELRVYWSYKLKETNFTAPVTLSFIVEASRIVDGSPSFTFDPGQNPELGQKWEINQDVTVDNETIHVLSSEQAGIEKGFFVFTMQSDSNIVGATIEDLEHPPLGGGGGGGGIPVAKAPFSAAFQYQTPLPQGPYKLTFIRVSRLVPGDWTLTWSP